MLQTNGEQMLKDFTARAYPRQVTEIIPGIIYHVMGYGHSNASFIISESSVILIDTLDSDYRAQKLKSLIAGYTDKPVKTIIYTHGHPDHRGGAGAFADSRPEIIAFAPCKPVLGRTDALNEVFLERGNKQFGYSLSDEENISQGIGIREGKTQGEGQYSFLPPTTVYREEKVLRDIDGVTLELAAAPGESDDQLLVWIPSHKVLCCGDNYYGCWPNLYPIRGGQYRDISAWVDTLDNLRAYQAEYLLPGHTQPILGAPAVRKTLTNFRDAIDYVLRETLKGMNQGLSMDEVAEAVKLPEKWASLPYLGEYYGTVAWSVRGIYTGYVGWFDGNPTHLNPLPPKSRAQKTIALMGGQDSVLSAIKQALDSKDYQWGIELADLLIAADSSNQQAKQYKAQGLMGLGKMETSANGRHYYLTCAKELLSGI
ncbi:alkyl sulfatase-like hydrolase [Desulfosporosinus orientis DSM 765]|uniref:Alkyl sulfatase-like hydrolase n=1 Tax=Desulfosporosinus orientis (strain ATCC 19365 / DSM 765 / NCIMB 8382 / VKM B-1628 / Singapore I) TaxID=768706 RepID=G7WF27_DESOD|nr:alkyl/aryl-sulfatase [Desulfosporosinus orientis]AET67638.1 alkyl sulfatase-like hydrolase [Desulfosporosinus orientis DSM 765]